MISCRTLICIFDWYYYDRLLIIIIIMLFALFSFIALHILGVQMSLERERCADVLINLPLLTSVTKLLTISKLLCRSEILWNIQALEASIALPLIVD